MGVPTRNVHIPHLSILDISYIVYSSSSTTGMSGQPLQLSQPFIESIAGFIAGLTSTCVSHPLDIVKTRLQLEGMSSECHDAITPRI